MKQKIFSRVCLILALCLAMSTFPSAPPARAEANGGCELTWEIVPGVASQSGGLYHVSASAANDVWAIGDADSAPYIRWTQHWDGAMWIRFPLPQSSNELYLTSIQAISSSEAWTVGSSFNAAEGYRALALHWTGTDWQSVALPLSDSVPNSLFQVSGKTTNDVWAIGRENSQPLLLHWEGTQWNARPDTISSLNFKSLSEVIANSPNDVYLAGKFQDALGVWYFGFAHWDGSSWQMVAQLASPYNSENASILVDFAAFAPNDLWAIYTAPSAIRAMSIYFVKRWDGVAWHEVDSTGPTYGGYISALAGQSFSSVWWLKADYIGPQVVHWDGAQIHADSIPMPQGRAYPQAVAVVSADDIWVTGHTQDSSYILQPYILHGHLPCAQIPSKPKLLSPTDGQSVKKAKVSLKWKNIERAHLYEIEVSQDKPKNVIYINHTYIARWKIELQRDHNYYWRVRACNNAGCGPWSPRSHFFVKP